MSNSAHNHGTMCNFSRPSHIGMDLQGNFVIGCLGGERFRLSRTGGVTREIDPEESQVDRAVFQGFQIIDGSVIRVSSYASGKTIAETSSRKFAFELPVQVKGFSFEKSSDTMHFLLDDVIISCSMADCEGQSLVGSGVCTPLKQLGVDAIAVSGPSRFVGISRLTGGLVEIQQISGESREVMAFGRAEEGGVRNLVSLVSDGYGNWAVLDRDNYRVVNQFADGEIGFFGSKGSGDKEIDWPGAAVMLDSTTLLIADTNNDRLVEVDLVSRSSTVIAIRETCPDRLSRPVSISLGPRGISICERGNGRITTVLKNGVIEHRDVLLNPGEQLSCFIPNRTDESFFGLVLGRTLDSGFLRRIGAPDSLESVNYVGSLFDPQGMVACSNSLVLVSDTRNRRALLISDRLNLVNEWDLAQLSGNPRFLCRVPSYVRGVAYLPDYESGLTVCIDTTNWTTSLARFRLGVMGLTAIRKLVAWGDKTVVLGRGQRPIIVLDSHFRATNFVSVGLFISETSVPVDALDMGSGCLLVVDKEADASFVLDEHMFRTGEPRHNQLVLERLE